MFFYKNVFASLLCASSVAWAELLDKPALRDNLNHLKQGLMDYLPSTPSTYTKWPRGWIADDCKSMTEKAGLDPVNVTTYAVTYNDCDTPWILCWHKDSPSPLTNLIDRFGRLPVRTREWVRHVIALPDPKGNNAYNDRGNIAMFNQVDNMNVFVHEAAHSLDLLGAFRHAEHTPLNNWANWTANYELDSHVPDNYARVNQVENVAQNTVVATFNANVQGGLEIVEPNWEKSYNLIRPGGTCSRRLTNSDAVPIVDMAISRVRSRDAAGQLGDKPDVGLPAGIAVIPPKEFHSGDCRTF
ncbi:MAG: hypothetical protein M1816_003048 [Peltula sp. TS41687]|nr:MAG: hypothetical protein M1816_003048 [Peltula sp. TS41687]